MEKRSVRVSDMLLFAHEWVACYEKDRKRTAILFRDTLLKMDKPTFDAEAYNHLIDESGEREETCVDAKKMARVLHNSWVWDENDAFYKGFKRRLEQNKRNNPFESMEIKKAKKGDRVKF